MKLVLVNPRGFCAGVYMAIDVVEQLVDMDLGRPIYVHHEIVHNKHVVDRFRRRGVRFVDSLDEVPVGEIDYVVTLCGDARDRCPAFPGAVKKEHWPIDDPIYSTGTPREMAEFRIFDGALTPAEIAADYNSACAGFTNPVCGNNVQEFGEQCDGTDEGICPGITCLPNCTCDYPATKIVELRADQANGTGPYPSSPGNGSPWVDLINNHDAALQAFATNDPDSGWQGTGLPPIGPNDPDPYRLEWDGSQGQTAFITGGSIPQLNPYDPNDGYSMTMWFRTDDVELPGPDGYEVLVEWRNDNSCPYAGMNIAYTTIPGPLSI